MSWSSDRRREVDPFRPDDDPYPSEEEGGSPGHWSAVARFANVAEAGYFADELKHRIEAPVRVHAEASFDGMHHFWRTRYALLVPESRREEAEAALAELAAVSSEELAPDAEDSSAVDETDAGSAARSASPREAAQSSQGRHEWPGAPSDDPRFDIEEPVSTIAWGPIVLTLTAGTAAFLVMRGWHEPRPAPHRPAAQEADALREFLSRSTMPWTQESSDGPARRTLRFDAEREAIVLEEDADGDGVPERTRLLR